MFLPRDSWGMRCDWALKFLLIAFISKILLNCCIPKLHSAFHISCVLVFFISCCLTQHCNAFLLSRVLPICVRGLGWRFQAMEGDYMTMNDSNKVHIPSPKRPWIIPEWKMLSGQGFIFLSVSRHVSFPLSEMNNVFGHTGGHGAWVMSRKQSNLMDTGTQ